MTPVATLRRRLDAELVRRGLADSRQGARQRIEAGDVIVSGATADKPARLVSAAEPIELQGPPPRFVGRGGLKLEAALVAFGIDVSGRRAIDVGASTGGFTDCLLQHGASSVVALDVGHGQLHERLRADDRVVVVERCNARDLGPDRCSDAERDALLGPAAPLVVADLSFISLRMVAAALAALVETGGSVVVLVKPQFEAGQAEVAPGRGVVRDPAVWERVLTEVVGDFAAVGLEFRGIVVSPVRGGSGNVEFLVHFHRLPAGAPVGPRTAVALADAVAGVPTWP